MIPSKQPAFTLVALAAAEDPGRQLSDSAFASENQVACKNPTSTDRIASSFSATSEIRLYFQMNLQSLKLPEKTSLLLLSGTRILRGRMLHYLLLRARHGILAEATVRRGTPARAQVGQEAFGRPACTKRHLIPVCSERCPRTASAEEDLRGRDHSRLLDGTTAGAPGGALGRCTTSFGNPRGTDGPSGRELLPKDLLVRSQDSSRPDFSRAETRPGFVPPKIYPSCCPTRVIMPIRLR